MSLTDDINIRIEQRAGRITLTRPEALNALTYDMAIAIEKALDEWKKQPDVKLVIIDAEGDRAFCAGGDIQQLYETGRKGDFEYGRRFWADEYRLNAKIANYPKPYIAIMDGIVMGGGVGISAHGSHRVVTENTLFAMPECGIGLVPDVGGNFILSRAPGHIGEYLATTGARLKASDTIYAGFADMFVPANKLTTLTVELCSSGLTDVLQDCAMSPDAGFLRERETEIYGYFVQGDAAHVADRLESSGDQWLEKQAALMRKGCPLSVACALELVRRSRSVASIEEVLDLEYRFTYRSMSHGEFIEGIRAQVIDKDRTPNWKWPFLSEISHERIEEMLAPVEIKG